jgi:hypothetical protein
MWNHIFPREAGGSDHEQNGSGRIFLPSILYTRDNSDSEQHDSADGDPMGRHVHQMSPVNQAANHDQETQRVQSE